MRRRGPPQTSGPPWPPRPSPADRPSPSATFCSDQRVESGLSAKWSEQPQVLHSNTQEKFVTQLLFFTRLCLLPGSTTAETNTGTFAIGLQTKPRPVNQWQASTDWVMWPSSPRILPSHRYTIKFTKFLSSKDNISAWLLCKAVNRVCTESFLVQSTVSTGWWGQVGLLISDTDLF